MYNLNYTKDKSHRELKCYSLMSFTFSYHLLITCDLDLSHSGFEGLPGMIGESGPPGRNGEPGREGRPGGAGIKGAYGVDGLRGEPVRGNTIFFSVASFLE